MRAGALCRRVSHRAGVVAGCALTVWAARWLSSVVATAVGPVTRSEQVLGTVLLMDGLPAVVLALGLVTYRVIQGRRSR
jgi:hypothetical protein